MNLSQADIELFFKLWYALIWNVNQKHRIVPKFKRPVYGDRSITAEPIYAVRNKLWENPQWIDEFLRYNASAELTETERAIIAGWRDHFVKGDFIVVRHLANYSVFMPTDNNQKLYGVCGISDPIKVTLPLPIPFLVGAVLLPFKGKIICDGLFAPYSISLGKNIKDDLRMTYAEVKKSIGIIEVLGEPPVLAAPPAAKTPPPPKPVPPAVDTKGVNVPKAMFARYMEVAEIIESFCDKKLTAEYKEICLRALQKLCRKRPSPVAAGKARTWACGIVYAIGAANFIFDRSQPDYMPASEIAEWFGLSKSTAGNKAAEINKLLNISYYNTEFQLKSIADNNSTVWFVKVNGFLVDVRHMPREVQVVAFRKGLIPYIPADREG